MGVSLGKVEKSKPELPYLGAVVGNGQEAISLERTCVAWVGCLSSSDSGCVELYPGSVPQDPTELFPFYRNGDRGLEE